MLTQGVQGVGTACTSSNPNAACVPYVKWVYVEDSSQYLLHVVDLADWGFSRVLGRGGAQGRDIMQGGKLLYYITSMHCCKM